MNTFDTRLRFTLAYIPSSQDFMGLLILYRGQRNRRAGLKTLPAEPVPWTALQPDHRGRRRGEALRRYGVSRGPRESCGGEPKRLAGLRPKENRWQLAGWPDSDGQRSIAS